jgi:hypothetical protein
MKLRLISIVGVLAALAVLPAFAGASAGGPYDSVNGAGWRGSVVNPAAAIRHFEVSARNGPHGVSGQFSETQEGAALATFRGDVLCLVVTGNQAIVGGVITSSPEPTNVGTGFAIGFIDNGSQTPDTVTLTDIGLTPPPQTEADCLAESFLFTDAPVLPFSRGNVVVNDAS